MKNNGGNKAGGDKGKAKKAPQKRNAEAEKPAKKAESSLEPLTEKEEWLCREFVCDFGENKTRAYMHVFTGHTYESARVLASKKFAQVNISARVKELREERNKRLEITGDRILAEYSKLAFYDPRNFFDADMRLRPINEMDPDHAAVIAGIETFHKVTGEDGDGQCVVTKIKLPDKKAALEMLGKHLKLWNDVGSKENPLVATIAREMSEEELLRIASGVKP